MPAVSDALHESFPEDDRLYRIYWAGELIMPKASDATSRVRIWLQELDSYGHIVRDAALRQVTESAGAIPKLVIGSHWRNGRATKPKWEPGWQQGWMTQALELVAPEHWHIVRAGDYVPAELLHHPGSQTWINRSDMKLSFTTDAGRAVYGHNARLVSARTTDGREVIIPCYEIFRAFYAGTTDLANAMLSDVWSRAEQRFVLGSAEVESDLGLHLSLDLAPGIPYSAVPYLSWLRFSADAKAAANEIYPETVRQGVGSHPVWIAARPPIIADTLKFKARTRLLSSRGSLLVTQISDVQFPMKVAELFYTVASRTVPVETTPPPGGSTPPPTEVTPRRKPRSVSRPGNTRPMKRFFQLPSAGVNFSGLPKPQRLARSIRQVPIKGKQQAGGDPVSRQVSVGVPGTRGAPPRAQFSTDEEHLIQDRFAAVLQLVDEMITEGIITSAEPYPIVRPAPNDAPVYCEFPEHTMDGKPCAWSLIHGPDLRPRLALVLEISIDEGERFVYWIETEISTPRKGHRSLVVETVDGSSLDEGTLEALLDTCAMHKGVWPEPLPFGEGAIVSTRARHIRVTGTENYTPNMMLRAFARLERAKTFGATAEALTMQHDPPD